MFKRIFSAALVFGGAALAPPADAQVLRCMARSDLIETLETKYSEQMVGGGLQSATQLVEVWSSNKTGSFTIFLTRPDGVSCLVVTGENWNDFIGTAESGVAG